MTARTPASALAHQEGGQHYKGMPIQPVEYIHANGIGYFEGNVIKYVSRWRNKNGLDDLKKARHYLDLLIELEGAKPKTTAATTQPVITKGTPTPSLWPQGWDPKTRQEEDARREREETLRRLRDQDARQQQQKLSPPFPPAHLSGPLDAWGTRS